MGTLDYYSNAGLGRDLPWPNPGGLARPHETALAFSLERRGGAAVQMKSRRPEKKLLESVFWGAAREVAAWAGTAPPDDGTRKGWE